MWPTARPGRVGTRYVLKICQDFPQATISDHVKKDQA